MGVLHTPFQFRYKEHAADEQHMSKLKRILGKRYIRFVEQGRRSYFMKCRGLKNFTPMRVLKTTFGAVEVFSMINNFFCLNYAF